MIVDWFTDFHLENPTRAIVSFETEARAVVGEEN